MRKFFQAFLLGAMALIGAITLAPLEASAMPLAPVAQASEAGVAPEAGVQKVYWRRYGWRRYGWRRPFGWRRPYGWGWRHPYRRIYRW